MSYTAYAVKDSCAGLLYGALLYNSLCADYTSANTDWLIVYLPNLLQLAVETS
jgi:hypothetical protein